MSLEERRIQPAFCQMRLLLSLANLTKVSLLDRRVGQFSPSHLGVTHTFSIFIGKLKL